MLYFQDLLKKDIQDIDESLERLSLDGDNDATLNYLYYMRDEISKRIKLAKKAAKQS